VNLGAARATPAAVASLAGALALCGCGTTRQVARPAPPVPVDLSVYVGARSVTVSPSAVGAGPVRLLIASQAPAAVVLAILPRGRLPVARSTTLAPGGTQQLSLVLRPGVYRLVGRPPSSAPAQAIIGGSIAPARLLVSRYRNGSGNALLQP
jgi:hypothetical protein